MNINRAAGLIPVRHGNGGTERNDSYRIANEYGTDIFRGDLVKSTGTGKQIAKSAAGERSVGVFAGCQYVDATGNIVYAKYWPANTSIRTGSEVIAYVYDDPDLLFEIQADEDIEAADIGGVADIVDGSGDTATGTSGGQLDSETVASTGSAQLKIMELVNRPDNSYGQYAKVLVKINEHELRAAMTAV